MNDLSRKMRFFMLEKEWFMMNQDALKAFRDAHLTGRDYDTLFAILEILNFHNYI